ncbi:DUF6436 domain-containing protein [Mucilaginibacter polytrichastri]|uniref:Thioredoxin domain-containing protein n=1 Tax=Mucilaginibacter polytrichastri TaxID=1302689 RepID=A0A1Q6A0R6_9SPHI|nr:thioredoxin fold domain-containing protein [Mucilaginibacter polytrichastri]OKS87588.1 hypothetical protein RG47T_3049 [Mucilaginibacter polytrichastri]SFS92524.1 AhpC/TSA family protein [Mucilaginibacter polytrichastri]
MKNTLIATWLISLTALLCSLFWYNEYRYNLPTPIPPHYNAIKNGQYVKLDQQLSFNNNKPVFLHFFNPDCPCSRFNIKHFKEIALKYSNRVNFAIIVISAQPFDAKAIQRKFELSIPVIHDPALAVICGVYSTPQAVIINSDKKLFYRGNYNRSRYCTDTQTAYARQALDDLVNKRTNSSTDFLATKAYGCQLSE